MSWHETLTAILRATTRVYRKGAVVERHRAGAGEIVHVHALPSVTDLPAVGAAHQTVDLHFVLVDVDVAQAEAQRQAFVGVLDAYPGRLQEGLSYIEVGAAVGDQTAAFQLFALGQVLGYWEVITPASLGIVGELADEMAGQGFVMISGLRAPEPAS